VVITGAIDRIWSGATVVCLGTGPSLTQADVDTCRGKARVIAIKHAIELAPWADALYSGEKAWWNAGVKSLAYTGLRVAIEPGETRWGATVLKNTGPIGLETRPTGLRTGKNSGYQAINLAYLFGAGKIVLLGYDMERGADGQDHFFGQHAHGGHPPLKEFLPLFETLVAPLAAEGVSVVNASRRTALTCFPRQTIAQALA
jgi:hypothetical protein